MILGTLGANWRLGDVRVLGSQTNWTPPVFRVGVSCVEVILGRSEMRMANAMYDAGYLSGSWLVCRALVWRINKNASGTVHKGIAISR